MKYVAHKHYKEFMRDLKTVFQAVNRDAAEMALLELDNKWADHYPVVIKSWTGNWHRLSAYFDFTLQIRRIVYTANTVGAIIVRSVRSLKIRALSRMIRLSKIVYLAYTRIRRNENGRKLSMKPGIE